MKLRLEVFRDFSTLKKINILGRIVSLKQICYSFSSNIHYANKQTDKSKTKITFCYIPNVCIKIMYIL